MIYKINVNCNFKCLFKYEMAFHLLVRAKRSHLRHLARRRNCWTQLWSSQQKRRFRESEFFLRKCTYLDLRPTLAAKLTFLCYSGGGFTKHRNVNLAAIVGRKLRYVHFRKKTQIHETCVSAKLTTTTSNSYVSWLGVVNGYVWHQLRDKMPFRS